MQVLLSKELDPFRNLAVEEFLLGQAATSGPILFLWQSKDAVIIGKNQNPWRECDVSAIHAGRCVLARRISGGGAVYHDEGNLNYAFFFKREQFKPEKPYRIILDALLSLGIDAERLGKSSIGVEGLKISGNAFCYRKAAVLHHGTLLLSARLDRMKRFLNPKGYEISTRAIKSEPAPVVNLQDIQPDLTVAALTKAIQSRFVGKSPVHEPTVVESEIDVLAEKKRRWDWCYGHTPPFDLKIHNPFPWGNCTIELTIVKGIVQSLRVESDAMDGVSVGMIEGALLDCPFKSPALARHLRHALGPAGHAFIEEIADWIEAEGF